MLVSLPLYVFPLCMLAAAITDIRKFIIPNTVSIALVFAFFISFALSSLDYHVLGNHVMTGSIMLIIGIAMFHFNICGAGDSKLLAAAALWLGWPMFGQALVYITLFGGALSLIILVARMVARAFPRLSLICPPAAKLAATEKLIAPYGVAIAVGAVYVFPQSALFQSIVGAG